MSAQTGREEALGRDWVRSVPLQAKDAGRQPPGATGRGRKGSSPWSLQEGAQPADALVLDMGPPTERKSLRYFKPPSL